MSVSPDAINKDINELMIYLSLGCLFALLSISIQRFLSNPDIRPNSSALGTKGQLSRNIRRLSCFFHVCQWESDKWVCSKGAVVPLSFPSHYH